jgi:hypothetical protein
MTMEFTAAGASSQSPFHPPQESAAVYPIGKDLICSVFCVRQSLPVRFTAAESHRPEPAIVRGPP